MTLSTFPKLHIEQHGSLIQVGGENQAKTKKSHDVALKHWQAASSKQQKEE